MKHEESNLQKQCVAWFRAQYPQYAMLLIHPINEGSGNSRTDRSRQAIHKAEGAVKGVPDLLLFLPNRSGKRFEMKDGNYVDGYFWYHGLGIEMKTTKGKQSQEQKDFQKMFESAQYFYVVVRSFEEFQSVINDWIKRVPQETAGYLKDCFIDILHKAEEREKEKFYKIIGKK